MRIVAPSCKEQLGPLRERLRKVLLHPRLSAAAVQEIVLAAHEAAVNAMVHGNRLDAARTIRLEVAALEHGIEVCVADEGEGFDWRRWLRHLETDGVAPDSPGGRGILVMVRLMDRVLYNASGNVVHLLKRYDLPERA